MGSSGNTIVEGPLIGEKSSGNGWTVFDHLGGSEENPRKFRAIAECLKIVPDQ